MGGRSNKNKKEEKSYSAPVDNSKEIKKMQAQMVQQNTAYEQERRNSAAAEKAKEEESARKAKEFAMQQEAATQSANARSLATTNQQEVGSKLESTLNAPIQTGTMNYGAQASGYNPAAAKQAQAATMGSAGTPAPIASPGAAIAAKVNANSGGTNAVQNRFIAPNTSGLTFGGT